MPETIPGAVVTYFPDTALADRLRAIVREVAPLLVADNTTNPAARRAVEAATKAAGASYLGLPLNNGVAGGLNAAFARLRAAGHKWAIAFDQDSMPEPGFAAALCRHATTSGCRIVGADWYDQVNPSRHSRHLQPMLWLPFLYRRRAVPPSGLDSVTFAITSGTLFNLDLWQQLGGFDPLFPLDYTDIDFCLRARRIGARVGIGAGARLAHNRGAKRPVRRFGHTWWPAFTPPERLTTLALAQGRVLRRHGWCAPHWVCYELALRLKTLGEILLLEDRRRSKISALASGLLSSILGHRVP